jgi:hypothetical protein
MSTNREKFYKKYNIAFSTSLSLEEISKLSNVPISILKEVVKRAGGAYSNNLVSVRLIDGTKNFNPTIPHSSRMSINQWKRARVFSFLMKGTTYFTTDSDLARKAGF